MEDNICRYLQNQNYSPEVYYKTCTKSELNCDPSETRDTVNHVHKILCMLKCHRSPGHLLVLRCPITLPFVSLGAKLGVCQIALYIVAVWVIEVLVMYFAHFD